MKNSKSVLGAIILSSAVGFDPLQRCHRRHQEKPDNRIQI